MPETITPADLWNFAKQIAAEDGSDWEAVLDPIGLLYDGDFPRYDATPINSEFFATTGGDGTHFVLLDAPGNPVVMVVPMAFERAHIVVGDNLFEFLCLGCRCGYFGIEQLAYDRTGTIEWIKGAVESPQNPAAARLLEAFRQRFGLEPISDPDERLKELRREHRSEIIVSDDYSFKGEM